MEEECEESREANVRNQTGSDFISFLEEAGLLCACFFFFFNIIIATPDHSSTKTQIIKWL